MRQAELYLPGLDRPHEVVAFQGSEGLFEPFALRVLARHLGNEGSLPAIASSCAAAFALRTNGQELLVHGVVTQVEAREADAYALCLQSPLELLDTASPELVFDGLDIPQAVAGLLAGLGFEPGRDFGFHLTECYAPWPELRSEGDSPFDFLFRMLGREGLCCLHEATEQGGMLLFSDAPSRLGTPLDLGDIDDPQAGRALLPAQVHVSGGPGEHSSQLFHASCKIPSGGRGTVSFTDQRLHSDADAVRLATLFAEQHACAGWNIRGGTRRPLRPGMHVRDINGRLGREGEAYLITEVAHQADFRTSAGYKCFFQAVPAQLRFRPQPHIPRRQVRAYEQERTELNQALASYNHAVERIRLQNELLELVMLQGRTAARMLEVGMEQLSGELDLYIWQVQTSLARLEARELALQEADRKQSELAWLRQRYTEERISLHRTFECWGEDAQHIVL